MTTIFRKKISYSEKKWNFFQFKIALVKKLPNKFDVHFNGLVFSFSINKANRINTKKLFSQLNLHEGDTILIEKKDKKYIISINPSNE